MSDLKSFAEFVTADGISIDATFDPYSSADSANPSENEPGREEFATSPLRVVAAAVTIHDAQDLKYVLAFEPGVRVITECRDTELASVIRQTHPDVVVLDICNQNSGRPGLRGGDGDGGPLLICVASDPQCAARAFEMSAVDFVLKPLDRQRLQHAMKRVRAKLHHSRYSRWAQELMGLLKQSRAQEKYEQLVFRSNGRLVFVEANDIDWISASANYVQVNAGAESYLVRESIGKVSTRLDPERFVRIHRSVIVNVRRIKELQSCNAGEYIAVLKNGKKLPCSRGFRGALERYIATCTAIANGDRS